MTLKEVVFGCGEALTPDVAAKLTALAERYAAKLYMECAGKRVLLDSLIGILSVECLRGTRLTVIADGPDEQDAADAVAEALEGR